ncbi:hypothetical protein BHO_0900009 [Borrelia hermsii YBT]|nr:hypothetical protein BHO_0900009 [Borrelia hermsii YBT]
MNIRAKRILYGKKSIIDNSSIRNASIEVIKVALKKFANIFTIYFS